MTASLAEEIARPAPEDGVTMWWLGQAGVVLRGSSGVVVIDPFLTDFGAFGRTFAPPLSPDQLTTVDALIGTHDHADHIDPLGFPEIMRASPAAVALVPETAAERVARLDVDPERIRGVRPGAPVEIGRVRVEPFAAVHADDPEAGYGFHVDARGRHPYVGVVVELDGLRVCHTGDTLVYDGLGSLLASLAPDVLLLPINGRSWYRERRGVAGNMNTFEAAELAAEVGARVTIPIHWDLIAGNTEDPEHFRRHAATHHPTVDVLVPTLGERVVLR